MPAVIALAFPIAALAHAGLATTSPEDRERLDNPPNEVVLIFEGELDPDGSGFVVTDADGADVGTGTLDLEVADRNELRGQVSIEADGAYTVAWTSRAADGHEEAGEFSFIVGGSDTAAPNTAVPAPNDGWPPALVVIGALLVVFAALIVARRVILR
ncbi:MAG: copper resistance CopC family protein [Candidatus Limnocylindria bacterium]